MTELAGALFALEYLLIRLRQPRSSLKFVSIHQPRRFR